MGLIVCSMEGIARSRPLESEVIVRAHASASFWRTLWMMARSRDSWLA